MDTGDDTTDIKTDTKYKDLLMSFTAKSPNDSVKVITKQFSGNSKCNPLLYK